MAGTFSKLVKKKQINSHIQEVQPNTSRTNTKVKTNKQKTPTHIIVKLVKPMIKGKILKAAGKKMDQ